jgi:hypothetical protein
MFLLFLFSIPEMASAFGATYLPPQAVYTYSPVYILYNQTARFDASASSAVGSGNTIVSYAWNWGNGEQNVTSDPIIYKIFPNFGSFQVTLNVTDSNGLWATTTKPVWVHGIVGDINLDGKVDITDIAIVSHAFGSFPGKWNWDPRADLTGPTYLVPDGKVDIMDLAVVSKHYGQHL